MQVTAIAYDNPIPGFGTNNTINLRLWAAKPGQEFDLEAFNTGDYVQVAFQRARPVTLPASACKRVPLATCSAHPLGFDRLERRQMPIVPLLQAILSRQRAETLSSVLYPDDRTYQGKELRLKQQHFFVSATIQVTP